MSADQAAIDGGQETCRHGVKGMSVIEAMDNCSTCHGEMEEARAEIRERDAIESIAGRAKTYLPNSSDRLALVALNDARPFRAYWPLRLTQLIGGKTWSLSIVRYQTKSPTPVLKGSEDEQ